MAQTEQKSDGIQWKPIAFMNLFDGRQYENKDEFNKNVEYKINSIGNYVGVHSQFIGIPKQHQLPKVIPNVSSLIDEDLNKGYKEVIEIMCE